MSERWVRVATLAAVEAEQVMSARADGVALALYFVDGAVHATAELCTHGAARLSDGYLNDGIIDCPLHQGLFDVRTGEAVGPPCTEAVRTYNVRIEDGQVLVQLG
jgi:naphthalene 1,2-dioxygenase system ferredoxin subunit